MESIFGNTVSMSQKTLDFLWKKQAVITDNIANSETLGYKEKYVTFETELKNRLNSVKKGNRNGYKAEIMDTQMRVKQNMNESSRLDGNNINVDVQSAELSRTTLQYEFAARAVSDELSRIRTAIKGQ